MLLPAAWTGAGRTRPTIDEALIERVLQELQSIRVGDIEDFARKAWLWEIDPEELYMEDILNGIIGLVIKQMGLEEYIKFNEETGLITVEGVFGEKLMEILGINPERDGGVLVEHVELREFTIGKTDCYTLTINCREIELELEDGFIGYDWAVGGLVLRQLNHSIRNPRGIPYTEERELFIHQVESKIKPGTYIMGASYTVRLYEPNGTLVKVEQWDFIEGNPQPVHYGKEEY
ncbi:MAG: hypothetical protein QXP01_00145 [Candidatus Hadarchaeum sp.]